LTLKHQRVPTLPRPPRRQDARRGRTLWVPRTMSRGLTWPHTAGPGAVSPTFGCADTSRSGTVGTRDPTLRLPGIAANARLDGPSRTVRSGQRRRDLGPATPDRRSPAATSRHPDPPGPTARSYPRLPSSSLAGNAASSA
jgi:hypothetical protein